MLIEQWKRKALQTPTPKGQGPKASAVNQKLTVLTRLFSLAVENGYRSQSPVSRVRRLRESGRPERVMTDSEEAAIREAMGADPARYHDLADFFTLAVKTGMRANEVVGLQLSEVDFGRREINLPAERTKEGKAKTFPVNSYALEVLERAGSDRAEVAGSSSRTSRTGGWVLSGARCVRLRCERPPRPRSASHLRFPAPRGRGPRGRRQRAPRPLLARGDGPPYALVRAVEALALLVVTKKAPEKVRALGQKKAPATLGRSPERLPLSSGGRQITTNRGGSRLEKLRILSARFSGWRGFLSQISHRSFRRLMYLPPGAVASEYSSPTELI